MFNKIKIIQLIGYLICFFLDIRVNKFLKSKIFNSLLKITKERTPNPPPKTADIKELKICRQILDIKCPSKLDGRIINEYFKEVNNRLIFRFGTTLLMRFKFNSEIKVIEAKKEKIILLIPIIGVSVINITNIRNEPKI